MIKYSYRKYPLRWWPDVTAMGGQLDRNRQFWDKHRDSNLNARQTKVLNKVLDKGIDNYEGGLNNRKYVAIAKTSTATATRDLKDLLGKGCVKLKEGTTGKSSSYIVVVPV